MLAVMRRGSALGIDLIDVIRNAINLLRRILDGLGGAICCYCRGLRGFQSGVGRSLGALRGLLGLFRRGFGLLGLNLLPRRSASREHQGEGARGSKRREPSRV